MRVDVLRCDPAGAWQPSAFPPEDGEDTVVLVFGPANLAAQPERLEPLRHAYRRAVFAGCSGGGVVSGTRVVDDEVLAVVLRFDGTRARAVGAPVEDERESFDAGRALGRLLAAPTVRAVLVFSEGLRVNGSELARGLGDALPGGVPVLGGLAGDLPPWSGTWVLRDRFPRAASVVAVALHGDRVRVRHASGSGWEPFGPPRAVTRSRGPTLLELDGRPALAVYRDYLGSLATQLPSAALHLPLALSAGPDPGHRIVRTVLGVDEEHGALHFAGSIPEGCVVRFMRASHERLVAAAREAGAEVALGRTGSARSLVLAVSCVGRRMALGERCEDEWEAVGSALSGGDALAGFYSLGEVVPAPGSHGDLQNQSIALTRISED